MCILTQSELSLLMWIIENELLGSKLVQIHWHVECWNSIHLLLVLVLVFYAGCKRGQISCLGQNLKARALACFPLVPSRIEQYYEAILALWNQLYINMKSLVSWHYCMIDIEKIRAMTIAKVHPQDHSGCLERCHAAPCGAWFCQADLLAVQLMLLCLIGRVSSACLRGEGPSYMEGEGVTRG